MLRSVPGDYLGRNKKQVNKNNPNGTNLQPRAANGQSHKAIADLEQGGEDFEGPRQDTDPDIEGVELGRPVAWNTEVCQIRGSSRMKNYAPLCDHVDNFKKNAQRLDEKRIREGDRKGNRSGGKDGRGYLENDPESPYLQRASTFDVGVTFPLECINASMSGEKSYCMTGGNTHTSSAIMPRASPEAPNNFNSGKTPRIPPTAAKRRAEYCTILTRGALSMVFVVGSMAVFGCVVCAAVFSLDFNSDFFSRIRY